MPDDFAKGQPYAEIYRRAFEFHRKFANAQALSELDDAADEANKITYNCTEFERQLISLIYDEIIGSGAFGQFMDN